MGKRFRSHYWRRRPGAHGTHRGWKIAAGIILILTGFVLLFIPGPGCVFLVIGAALLAEQSHRAARLLDGLEIRLRVFVGVVATWWRRISRRFT